MAARRAGVIVGGRALDVSSRGAELCTMTARRRVSLWFRCHDVSSRAAGVIVGGRAGSWFLSSLAVVLSMDGTAGAPSLAVPGSCHRWRLSSLVNDGGAVVLSMTAAGAAELCTIPARRRVSLWFRCQQQGGGCHRWRFLVPVIVGGRALDVSSRGAELCTMTARRRVSLWFRCHGSCHRWRLSSLAAVFTG